MTLDFHDTFCGLHPNRGRGLACVSADGWSTANDAPIRAIRSRDVFIGGKVGAVQAHLQCPESKFPSYICTTSHFGLNFYWGRQDEEASATPTPARAHRTAQGAKVPCAATTGAHGGVVPAPRYGRATKRASCFRSGGPVCVEAWEAYQGWIPCIIARPSGYKTVRAIQAIT